MILPEEKGCSNCDYKTKALDEYPCDNCGPHHSSWEGFIPPNETQLLQMRIEHLEAIVLGLLSNPICSCSKIAERNRNDTKIHNR